MIPTLELARNIRIHALKMVNKGKSSHIGSILSIADILAVLYGKIMNYDASNPRWLNRDRFILSKGHAGAGVYAALAECDFFDKTELMNHYQDGSKFSGHVSHKGIPGVEFSTGSLGHGLPVAAGMAYYSKLEKLDHAVYVLLSDGELNEGSNWEAFLFAAHHNLSHLTVIIDRNRLQSMADTEMTLKLEPLADKLNAFGFEVYEIDGHNHRELSLALGQRDIDKPSVVIANTIKGKGVSFMENKIEWHYKTPLDEMFEHAISEIEGETQ